MSTSVTPKVHRRAELWLLLIVGAVFTVGIMALEFSQNNNLSTSVLTLAGMYVLTFALAHFAIRKLAPYSDQVILPCVAFLNALGLLMIYRLDLATDTTLARSQALWTAIGVLGLIGILVLVKNYKNLADYSYLMGLAGLILLALPIFWPTSMNADAQVWISIGPFSIQPGEFAKILLLLFFAGVLAQKRTLFRVAGKQFLGLQFPRMRDLVPILAFWAIALLIMAFQNDFGPTLLLFGTILGMIYIATSRASWLVIGAGLAAVGAVLVYQISDKIQVRVQNFLDPVAHYDGLGYQLSQSLFGISYGGLTGTGLGEGYPYLTPVAHSDFILSALAEELGFVGIAAILMVYVVIVARGMMSAMNISDSYGKLVASGLALTIAIQVFVVAGGISRLIPMTGLTTPWIAHGGSSLLANYILLALMLRISNSSRRPWQPPVEPAPAVALEQADAQNPAEVAR